jgi:hypothetical protein
VHVDEEDLERREDDHRGGVEPHRLRARTPGTRWMESQPAVSTGHHPAAGTPALSSALPRPNASSPYDPRSGRRGRSWEEVP